MNLVKITAWFIFDNHFIANRSTTYPEAVFFQRKLAEDYIAKENEKRKIQKKKPLICLRGECEMPENFHQWKTKDNQIKLF